MKKIWRQVSACETSTVQVSNSLEVLLGICVATSCCGGGVKWEEFSACVALESSDKVAESADVSFLSPS